MLLCHGRVISTPLPCTKLTVNRVHLVVTLQCLDGFLRVGVPHSNASVEASRHQVVKPLHDHHSHDDIRVPLQRHHFLALADIPP